MSHQSAHHQEPIGSELVQEDASFADIVVQFVEGLDNRLAKMQDAIEKSDFEALRGAAHQLKGSGGGYGYPILTELAAELERFAQSEVLDDCKTALDELKNTCSCVVVESDA
ncbi:MAG: Hpt domain-containing protein [Planctomycetes bacterium]|nr:Hpt domain-containing protein [Planctomycetota bacterium]